jgi:hypothetical protein
MEERTLPVIQEGDPVGRERERFIRWWFVGVAAEKEEREGETDP